MATKGRRLPCLPGSGDRGGIAQAREPGPLQSVCHILSFFIWAPLGICCKHITEKCPINRGCEHCPIPGLQDSPIRKALRKFSFSLHSLPRAVLRLSLTFPS